MLAKIIQDGLRKHGFHILETKVIQHGTQIRLLEGAIINIYGTPKILVQGKSVFGICTPGTDYRLENYVSNSKRWEWPLPPFAAPSFSLEALGSL